MSEQHIGTLVSGEIVCSCGWKSGHFALADDAARKFYEHDATERNRRDR